MKKKIMQIQEPHIQISLPYGFERNPESVEFVRAIHDFIQAYKKFYRLIKIDVKFAL